MSRYSNYVMKNNVFAELNVPVSSLWTTLQLKSWQWARRGTDFPILATLESFNSSWKCTKREIVRITAISWDNLTVVRWVAPCPSSDDANTQWTTTFSFQADDKLSLYITKEHFDKVEDWFTNTNNEIDDLHTNGTDELRTYKTTWLWVEVKAGKVLVWSSYYDFEWWTLTLTNNATNYIEINENGILVANTTGWTDENTKISKVTTSGWNVTNIEDWRLWTIGGKINQTNIHELTDKLYAKSDDELLIADSENIYQNKKIKADQILYWTWKSPTVENISKWDMIYSEAINDSTIYNIWIWYGSDRQKIAIKRIWNWIDFDEIKIALSKYWTPSTLSVRIETDNNWVPSWTLVNENAYWSISWSSLTTAVSYNTISLAWTVNIAKWTVCYVVLSVASYNADNFFYLWWWTEKTNLFTIKQYNWSEWWNLTKWLDFNIKYAEITEATPHIAYTSYWWYWWYNKKLWQIVLSSTDVSVWLISGTVNKTWNKITWLSNFSTNAISPFNEGMNFCWWSSDWYNVYFVSNRTYLNWYKFSKPFDITNSPTYQNTYNFYSPVGYCDYPVVSDNWLYVYFPLWTSIKRATLSTPYNPNTATIDQTISRWTYNSEIYQIFKVQFSYDWKTLLACWTQGDTGYIYIWQFNLTTAFDLTSMVYVWNIRLDVNGYWNDVFSFIWDWGVIVSNWAYQYLNFVNWQDTSWTEINSRIKWDWLFNEEIWKADKDIDLNNYSPMSAIWDYSVWDIVKWNVTYNDTKTWLTIWTRYFLWDNWWITTTKNKFPLWVATSETLLKYSPITEVDISNILYNETVRWGNDSKQFTITQTTYCSVECSCWVYATCWIKDENDNAIFGWNWWGYGWSWATTVILFPWTYTAYITTSGNTQSWTMKITALKTLAY